LERAGLTALQMLTPLVPSQSLHRPSHSSDTSVAVRCRRPSRTPSAPPYSSLWLYSIDDDVGDEQVGTDIYAPGVKYHRPSPLGNTAPSHSCMMSIVLSISTVLSLLSFLTTVLALIRVGSAAFNNNLVQSQLQLAALPLRGAAGVGPEMQALAVGLDEKSENSDGCVKADIGLKGGYLGGHELVRMPVNWSSVRKPAFLLRPSSPIDNFRKPKPLSMAKLIMSRHSQRRPRSPPPRRPPGLSSIHTSHSPLVDEVPVS